MTTVALEHIPNAQRLKPTVNHPSQSLVDGKLLESAGIEQQEGGPAASGKTSPHNLEQLEKIISYLEYLPTLYLIMYPPLPIRSD